MTVNLLLFGEIKLKEIPPHLQRDDDDRSILFDIIYEFIKEDNYTTLLIDFSSDVNWGFLGEVQKELEKLKDYIVEPAKIEYCKYTESGYFWLGKDEREIAIAEIFYSLNLMKEEYKTLIGDKIVNPSIIMSYIIQDIPDKII